MSITPDVIVQAPLFPDSKPGLLRSCCDDVQPVTLNELELVAVPPAVVTEIAPLEEQFGTVALICVELTTLNDADCPLNLTAVAPVKFVPVIVTLVPTPPEAGEKPLMVGAGVVVPPMKSSYSRRFGEPVPGLATTPLVELLISALATVAGDAVVFVER